MNLMDIQTGAQVRSLRNLEDVVGSGLSGSLCSNRVPEAVGVVEGFVPEQGSDYVVVRHGDTRAAYATDELTALAAPARPK